MDKKTLIFLITDAAIILAFILLKNVNYSKSSRKMNIRRWLYFSNYEIINSTNERVRTARKIENRLSIALLVLLLLSPLVFFLIASF